MTDAAAATQQFYGRWARLYDVVATAPGITSWREAAVDALDLSSGDTVVEMGCGTGANLPYLREAVGPAGRVIGVDLTPGMLRRARQRAAANGWDTVHLVRGDATRPPIDGPVDAVLATFVVGMFATPGEVVRDWADLLGSGGRLALLHASPSDRAVAAPLNRGFQAFVRLAAPGGRATADSPARKHEARIDAATEALAGATVDATESRLALGFLRLAVGRRE